MWRAFCYAVITRMILMAFNENELLLQLRAYFGQVSHEAAVGATGAFSRDSITWIGTTI